MMEKMQQTRLANLRINNMEMPQVVDDATPAFSWQMVSGRTGAKQTAYRILVTQQGICCWDSGKVESSLSVGIPYPRQAAALEAEKDYRWALTVWDETGAALKAESAFSTGLMGKDLKAWHGAKWIGPDEIALAAETIPAFRLQFEMQIAQGGSSAGVVFGAGDPRLKASTNNNYLIV